MLQRIIDSWDAVENPAIVTLVVDTSGSMRGEALEQGKEGLTRLLDSIVADAGEGTESQVGLVTFSDAVETQLAPAPLDEARYDIADAIFAMRADGSTALYDAIEHA